ncbi:ribonuclease P protein component [Nonomuraea ferruginea]
MLSRPSRMRRGDDFQKAIKRGNRAGRPTLVIHLAVSGEETPLVGFVVSRAVGGAVVRNKVKRRLRHLMRERLDRLPRGSLLVVRANPRPRQRDTSTSPPSSTPPWTDCSGGTSPRWMGSRDDGAAARDAEPRRSRADRPHPVLSGVHQPAARSTLPLLPIVQRVRA